MYIAESSVEHRHVVSIPGAESLTVTITYGGESANYDWACMWEGNHPDYTAANNYSSSLTGKLGGGSHTAASNTKTYTINGDTVTFAFKSDGGGYGDGYGYYATVTGNVTKQNVLSGEYLIPVPNDSEYRFKEWNTAADGSGNSCDVTIITESLTLNAVYEEDLVAPDAKGDWWKIKGDGTLIIGNGSEMTIPVDQQSGSGSVWPWRTYKSQIQSARFIGTVHANPCTGYMFTSSTIASIDFTNFDTSNVTDMSRMFYGCSKLTSLDLSNFDTSNVTNMNTMFSSCSSLTSLDLSSFDTSKVTDMHDMFYRCSKLASLDVSGWNTSNVTNMSNMFAACTALKNVDVSSWNTANLINAEAMFYGCSSLTELDLSR